MPIGDALAQGPQHHVGIGAGVQDARHAQPATPSGFDGPPGPDATARRRRGPQNVTSRTPIERLTRGRLQLREDQTST